jgi:hypothetical protein
VRTRSGYPLLFYRTAASKSASAVACDRKYRHVFSWFFSCLQSNTEMVPEFYVYNACYKRFGLIRINPITLKTTKISFCRSNFIFLPVISERGAIEPLPSSALWNKMSHFSSVTYIFIVSFTISYVSLSFSLTLYSSEGSVNLKHAKLCHISNVIFSFLLSTLKLSLCRTNCFNSKESSHSSP